MRGGVTRDIRERLRERRRDLIATVAATGEELRAGEARAPGGIGEDATTDALGVMLSRLEAHERRELEEIIAAEARLRAGTYGTCEACGSDIGAARLLAVPATRRCLTCQMLEEAVR